MKKWMLLIVTIYGVSTVKAQQKPAYVLYNSNGKKVGYNKMIKDLVEQDVVLFGEYHNNPISHWLELSVTKDCYAKIPLILGAEMFEQDDQPALTAFVQGKTNEKTFASSARFWSNYATDYAPIIQFAREHTIEVIATNTPRKYAALVAKNGFSALDTLSSATKNLIAPLPIAFDSTLPGYKNMIAMMGDHGSANMVKAQAFKDATMAYFIQTNTIAGKLFLHFNGSYHSDYHDGIFWHLRNSNPALKIKTITTVTQKNIKKLLAENKQKADYIICVDEDMTNTY
ncbi:ChaN family lipoprotein [Ferruginibacter yonginensis]|uniref:ChaN family lipoprotein n=1 Tax=Ferruginibacter yonginensis TaxID=1310416 RepID=A0ABV8QRE7_9BACT